MNKKINTTLQDGLQYSRILALKPSKVNYNLELRSHLLSQMEKEQLKALPPFKSHVRLLHQSTEGLRDLFEGTDTVLYPKTSLPDISLNEYNTTTTISDSCPTTGQFRKTLRVVLNMQDNLILNEWLKEFCELNNLPYSQREFHVSIATLTGKPGSSCR